MDDMILQGTGYSITPCSLQIDEGLHIEDFRVLIQQIHRMRTAGHWALGDAMNYGERNYGDGLYDQVSELTGFAYGTLRNDSMVARVFELSRRRDNLSFAHHQVVCSKQLTRSQADDLLEQASHEGWTLEELRGKKQLLLEPPESPPAAKPLEPPKPDHDVIETLGLLSGKTIPNQKIADDIAQAKLDVEPFIKGMALVNKTVKKWVMSPTQHPCFVGFTSFSQLQVDIKNVINQLKKAVPAVLCAYCGGDGCQECCERGWLNQFASKTTVPEELKSE